MKKEGSILVEVMVSINILALATAFIFSTSIQNLKILKKRILSEDINRTVYNLINEIKYNTSNEELENLLSTGELCLKYKSNISKKLITNDIKDLEKGEEIKIFKVGNQDDLEQNLRIEANVKDKDNIVNIEKDFTKSWWMNQNAKM